MDAFIPFISIPRHLYPNSDPHSLTPQLHAITLKLPLSSTHKIHLNNSLIRLYSQSNSLHHAFLLFNDIPPSTRDVITYTTIISSAVSSHRYGLALSIFHSMPPLLPDLAILILVLKSCSKLGALSTGQKAHRLATRIGISRNPNIITALIDMYSKSGRLDLAEQLFDRMLHKDLWSWTAMIGGFAAHGKCKESLELFYKMEGFGLVPNERTFTTVLSACKNSGWVNEGCKIFNSMHKYGVKASIHHYGCMVDLLVRAGRLGEAEDIVRRMDVDVKPDSVIWRNLIWGCKLHGDYERARRLIHETENMELDSGSGDMYILKENVHASKMRVRRFVSRKKVEKLRGRSAIEIGGVVHEFEAGDGKHRMSELIYEKLEEMKERLRSEGYTPVIDEVVVDGDEVEKCLRVGCHSEKLALALGLICGGEGREGILIVKNLRACRDCHSWMKYASRVYGRDIVVRDRVRFHRFSNGSCSCGDYW